MSLSELFTLGNLKGFVHAFARGFADSLRGAVDLFLLDSQGVREKELKLIRKDLTKDLLLSRERRADEPVGILAKRRSVERRERRRPEEIAPVKSVEPRILERTLKCCALNGCVFWLSILLFENGVLPGIRAALSFILSASSSSSKDLADRLWDYTLPVLSAAFSALWVLPFFLLSKIVNAIWFQDIADSAFKSSKGRPQMMPSLTLMIADTVFSLLVESIFLVQGKLCSFLPIKIIGEGINLFHLCLLYSLYCFEYKWFNQGLELHKRLTLIEANWPYFLGFGFPLAVLTNMPSNLVVSGCVFSMFFPLFIVSGNQAQVVTGSCSVSLHLFSPTLLISNALFARLFE